MNNELESIAIIGMSGRFPGAGSLDEFWRNLREGREAVESFRPDDTEWLPIERRIEPNNPHFVRARSVIERPEWFDASFFQINPREAAIMDPQQRVFLECAWEALESAGCIPEAYSGSIGVFAGSGFNTYLFSNLLTNGMLMSDHGLFAAITLNDKDYVATRTAYKLDLRGPALNVQTACSTSLVAVCLACQNLLSYQCDVALAGGVSIPFPSNRGWEHVEGGILSADGHCRAFDAGATGTVPGAGAGVVVLKRLSEAVAEGDRIRAVIKGHAINNDGHAKIGFTAPGIDGQAECIALAQTLAAFDPSTIDYVEAHGTGTPLGDPIEIAALKKAFGPLPRKRSHCAVGSLKSNIGHLDVAAGVAGLIKTTLALEHGEIPPTLHFQKPNPALELEGSPFFIAGSLLPWPRRSTPRRAGISSFGIGGTNAHVVIEEAPLPPNPGVSRSAQLLVLSARTEAALERAAANLAIFLETHPDVSLADVAYTLQTGRRRFEHRRAWVATDVKDAIAVLRSTTNERTLSGKGTGDPRIGFMFSGQGAQTLQMGRELYELEPLFREQVDLGFSSLIPLLGIDLRALLFPVPKAGATHGPEAVETTGSPEAVADLLNQTRIAQPALFVIEYALVRLWRSWGIAPAAMVGHSLGEYVAACVAGVFTFEEGLSIIAERGRLTQLQPPGAMLAALLPEPRAAEFLAPGLAIAGVNAPNVTVFSGSSGPIAELENRLFEKDVPTKRIATSHAFHSPLIEPALEPFRAFLSRIRMRAPEVPWVSNLTGTWVTAQEATSPDYWVSQMRSTVRFADALGELARGGFKVLLEIGPGQTLATLALEHPAIIQNDVRVTPSLEPNRIPRGETASLLRALGSLWTAGARIDWLNGFYANEARRRVDLPTYPFERVRCWIEPGNAWLSEEARPRGPKEPTGLDVDVPKFLTRPTHARNRLVSSTEQRLAEIFRELSGIELADAFDKTFNELGFDSLLIAQAATALAREFGTPLALRQLQDELRTIRQLAEYLDKHVESEAPTPALRPPQHMPEAAPARPPHEDSPDWVRQFAETDPLLDILASSGPDAAPVSLPAVPESELSQNLETRKAAVGQFIRARLDP